MADIKARRKGFFFQRHEEWLSSPAYRDLSPAARCLLEEFQRIYRPSRNGQLSISTRRAARLLNIAEGTARNLFYDLAEHGFIQLSDEAQWQDGKAREWRLTLESHNGRQPTDDWKRWTPDNPLPAPPRPQKKSRRQNVLRYRVKRDGGSASKCTAVGENGDFNARRQN